MADLNQKMQEKKSTDKPEVKNTNLIDQKEIDDARKNGFLDITEWHDAKEKGIVKYSDYQLWQELSKKNISINDFFSMLEGNFTDIDQWTQAHNEGFDNKVDWEDWQEIKNSGFTDIDLFYESKSVSFIQNSLRKTFLKDLKLAQKGGFKSYQEWTDAKKWGVRNFETWNYIKGLGFSSESEYILFKEFKIKLLSSVHDFDDSDASKIQTLKDSVIEDFNYDTSDTNLKTLVYKDFTRQRFEEILELAIQEIINDNGQFNTESLKESIIDIKKLVSDENQLEKAIATIICPNCRKETAKANSFCSECGEKIEKCFICDSSLFTERNAICPNCKTKFHYGHFKEYIKISGCCPKCRVNLNELDLI